MEKNIDSFNQTEIETFHEKNNKTKIIIIVLLIIILLVLVGYIVSKQLIKENKNKPKENQNTNYKLVKYADYNENITQIIDANFFDDYFVLSGYNRHTTKHSFWIFKNGKKVDLGADIEKSDVRRIEDLNNYYLFEHNNDDKASIVDISGKNSNVETYDYIYPIGNVLLVIKNNKYGLIDADGKTIIDLIYDNIQQFSSNEKYLFAQLNGKVGIINTSGEIIIPIEYDYDKETNEYNYFDYGIIIEDEETYFILKSNNEFVVLDENNNVIIKDKRNIDYDSNINYFIINKPNTKIYEYYSTNGTLKKEIDYNSQSFSNNVFSYFDTDFRLFQDKNNDFDIFTLDKNLNITKYSNVYYIQKPDEVVEGEEDFPDYFINNNVFVTYEEEKYYLKSTKNNSTIGTYSFIDYIYFDDVDDLFVACKEENSCGLIDLSGNEITSFNYELIRSSWLDKNRFSMLKSNEERIVFAHNKWQKITCNPNQEKIQEVFYIYGDFFVDDDYLFNSKCEIINEKTIRNYEYLDNGFMVAEIDEMFIETDDRDTYGYYIFDNFGKQINYDNSDNAKLQLYLAYNDNKMYFLTDKGIYYLTSY